MLDLLSLLLYKHRLKNILDDEVERLPEIARQAKLLFVLLIEQLNSRK